MPGQPASPLPPPEGAGSDDDGDGDGIVSYEDGFYDWDGDGLPNYLDLDSNDNGILDAVEAGEDPENPADTNGNGIRDFVEMRLYLPYLTRG